MLNIEKAIQRVKDRCKMIGEDVDVYKIMYQYKAIRELDTDMIDAIYDEVVNWLGFCELDTDMIDAIYGEVVNWSGSREE